ncbi:MAG: LysR family transcriptional regulator [Bdellovibrionaceae bacterium]|nr:LysR family transcriptional regulator [Pseudobdellovibrionaceae bacterium]MBX3034603.1 LysR family transcriptional regulator [Pseudobdellovibrionaceae bacterium]
MAPMDLNHLSVFVKIAETGSLTKAAQALGQPKSRVSRILSSLERDLKVQLIHRTTRHLQLTDIGKRFYEHCKGPLAGLEEAARDLSDCTQEVQGRIRLTAAHDVGAMLLPPIIDDFSRLYPRVEFEIILAQESLNLVRDSIDIAIRIGQLKDSSLKSHRVADLMLILVASPGFLESHPVPNQLSDLGVLPCLGFEAVRGKGWTFTNGREKRTLRVDHAIVANNPEFILKVALRGRGVALLPDILCRDHLQNGKLVHLFRSWHGEPVPINLIFPYQKQMPHHVRRFMDFLLNRLRASLGHREI